MSAGCVVATGGLRFGIVRCEPFGWVLQTEMPAQGLDQERADVHHSPSPWVAVIATWAISRSIGDNSAESFACGWIIPSNIENRNWRMFHPQPPGADAF